jgi:zinc transport system substrate-binding protein
MKSSLRTAAAALGLSGLILTGCGSGSDSEGGRPLVTASVGPLAWVAHEVGGDEVQVKNLTAPGVEPHDMDLGIAQIAEIEKSQLLVILSGFQPAIDKAAENISESKVLDAADVVHLEPATDLHEETDDSHEGHDHGDLDPHFWQDPLRMADLADAVASTLGQQEPDHADEFTRRAEELRSRLVALDEEYRKGLSGCARTTVVVSHEAFGYLSKYGLEFEAINGLSPGAEPTPADLARLQKLIRTDGITTVFSEELGTKKLAQTLAQDAGVKSEVLDTLEGMTTTSDYFGLMRDNLTTLQAANGCTP